LKTFKGDITDSRKPKSGFAEKYFKISIARRPTDFHLTNITFLGFLDIWIPWLYILTNITWLPQIFLLRLKRKFRKEKAYCKCMEADEE
jgi:hypothetical protein